MKCASISEKLPRGLPGKQRLMSRLSIGDRRVSLRTAGILTAGIMITRPCTSPGCSVCASREMAIGPSYSSPWTPPVSRTVGPRAVLDDDDGYQDGSPAGGIARERRANVACLPTIPVEIDVADDAAFAGG